MSLASKLNIPYDMKTSVVKIHSYENKNLKGVLINPYYDKEQTFESTIPLLLLMETVFDSTCPQSSFGSRAFNKSWTKEAPGSAPLGDEPVLATFNIRVIFRQNASWQGTISRPDKGDEAAFRSALEMLFLIDSALSPL